LSCDDLNRTGSAGTRLDRARRIEYGRIEYAGLPLKVVHTSIIQSRSPVGQSTLVLFENEQNASSWEHIVVVFQFKAPDIATGLWQLEIYLNREPRARMGNWTNGTEDVRVYRLVDGTFKHLRNHGLPQIGENFSQPSEKPLTYHRTAPPDVLVHAAGLWQAGIPSQARAVAPAMLGAERKDCDVESAPPRRNVQPLRQRLRHVPHWRRPYDDPAAVPRAGRTARIDLGVAALERNAVTMVGSGDCGLIEVLDVPAPLREVVPEGLAALSFLSNDAGRVRGRADASAHDMRSIDIGVPGFELFFCTVGGVPIEFMGGYSDNIDLWQSHATNS
jgi:hypothetical protein